MKIEVGKEYRTRDGEIAVICERAQNPFDAWPLKGTVGMRERSWTNDGRAGCYPENDSLDDLVAEWQEQPAPKERVAYALAVLTDPEAKAFAAEMARRFPEASISWDADFHEVQFLTDTWSIIVLDGGPSR